MTPMYLPAKFKPVKVRVDQAVIVINRRKSGAHFFRYTLGKKSRQIERVTLAAAKEEALRIATGIENGRAQAGSMTAVEAAGYFEAVNQLSKLGAGAPPLGPALAEYIAAKQLLPAGTSLQEAVRGFLSANPSLGSEAVPLAEVLERFLLVLSDTSSNPRHLRGRKHDLARFLAWLPADKRITEVSAEEIQNYLRALTGGKMTDQWNGRLPKAGTWPAIGPRRRDNIRDAIGELFTFAKRQGLLPEDRQTVVERIKRIKPVHEIRYYTPEQLRGWMTQLRSEWVPWFVLCAFAGLRSTEVVGDPEKPDRPRLHWEHFRWEKGYVVVPATTARKINRARRAPLKPNVLAWLLPWRQASGPLYPVGADQEQETDRLQKRLKRKWVKNGLRHSYGTHRNAELGNASQLAEEMGTSVAMIRKHYDAVPADIEPEEYFAITPPTGTAEIIAFPTA